MNLTKLNLVELSSNEMKETEGGFWQAVAATMATYLVISAMENPNEFMESLLQGL